MRVHLCLALALSGCSLDWSSAQSKDGGGAGGGGGAVGGSGGAVGGSGGAVGGTGASTNGGSAGAAGACAANVCIGEVCNTSLPCGVLCKGGPCPVCADIDDGPDRCVAAECFQSVGAAGGGSVIFCDDKCTDVCGKFGMCCVSGICDAC